jgi:hypothetical protein
MKHNRRFRMCTIEWRNPTNVVVERDMEEAEEAKVFFRGLQSFPIQE